MKRKIIFLLLVAFASLIVGGSLPGKEDNLRIQLRWVRSHEKETWSDVRTGLAWSLSYLGAMLPKGALDSALVRKDSSVFELDLARVGFSGDASQTLAVILDSLKRSEEYRSAGATDLGRFLVLTLHSSWHYYAITGVKKSYAEFVSAYKLEKAGLVYPLVRSGVASHHRRIRFNKYTDARKMAFVAEESEGSVLDNTFQPAAFEVFDVMPNGQLRFAIYDQRGDLLPASPGQFGAAGKPSKCLWCHESSILPVFLNPPDVPASMSAKTYIEYVTRFQKILNEYRKTLDTEIDYSQLKEHTLSELLYIGFMEPSFRRTAEEWNVTDSTLAAITAALPQHTFEEFLFLGDLWHRSQVDSLAPYSTVKVPQSVREMIADEPDYAGWSGERKR